MLMRNAPQCFSISLPSRRRFTIATPCNSPKDFSKVTADIIESKKWRPPTQDQAGVANTGLSDLDKYEPSAAIKLRSRDFTLVDTTQGLQAMLQELQSADSIAIDCEGVNLGQAQGQLCLMQLAVRRKSHSQASDSTSRSDAASIREGEKAQSKKSDDGRVSQPSSPSSLKKGSEVTLKAETVSRPSLAQQAPSQSPGISKTNSNMSSNKARPSPGSPGLPLLIYVLDIHVLDWKAFHHRLNRLDPTSINLKSLLESPRITKLIYDVRGDSANLIRQFDIKLRGVYDLQLAEVASRQLRGVPASWVLPLEKSLSNCVPRSSLMEQDIVYGHYVSKHYHQGNRMQVWQERPLLEELLHYAAADVRYLHQLEDALNHQLPPTIIQKVRNATITRTRMGDLPGVPRSAAPEIVRFSDIRQLTQQAKAGDR